MITEIFWSLNFFEISPNLKKLQEWFRDYKISPIPLRKPCNSECYRIRRKTSPPPHSAETSSIYVKFVHSEKATKFCEIFTLFLSTVHTDKSKVKISQNFVAFLEYMNFKKDDILIRKMSRQAHGFLSFNKFKEQNLHMYLVVKLW